MTFARRAIMHRPLMMSIVVPLFMLAAAVSGAYHFSSRPASNYSPEPLTERSHTRDILPAPEIEVGVKAYVRCESPEMSGDIEWMMRMKHNPAVADARVEFVPSPGIETLEFGNPDGSMQHIAVLKGKLVLRRSFAPMKGSFENSQLYPPGDIALPPTGKPTIVLKIAFNGTKLDIRWTTANLNDQDCKVYFKTGGGETEKLSPSICSIFSPSL